MSGKTPGIRLKEEEIDSKLTSCLACRRAGRMAIHAVKVEDFHSK